LEAKLERQAVKWLKEQGAYVIKNRAGPGVPVGAPDRIFVYGPKWSVIEFKASATAPYRPGQRETLDFLRRGNRFVYTAYPENWEEVKRDLLDNFFC
jgi:Holliday junction resolvase